MNPIADRLATALADRYRLERELGAGGRPPSISPRISAIGVASPSRCSIPSCAARKLTAMNAFGPQKLYLIVHECESDSSVMEVRPR